MNYKLRIKEAIAKDLKKGFDLIEEIINKDSSSYNDFILNLSRFNSLERNYSNGLITAENYVIQSNRIRSAILNFVDNLEDEDVLLPVETRTNPVAYPTRKQSLVKNTANEGDPKVFISYSWDSAEHEAWVRKLADDLFARGVNVILDKYELRAGNHLNFFMENSVRDAEKVLLILTEEYKQKADYRKGGVGAEYNVINEELYRNQINNEKFIPVLRSGDKYSSTPTFVQSYIAVDMTVNANYSANFEILLRAIHNKPEFDKPEISKD